MRTKQPDKLEVAYAMQRYGNAFIKALANLIIVANKDELQRIKKTFFIEWNTFACKAEEMRG